jgi:class 3 adenylate cyclase
MMDKNHVSQRILVVDDIPLNIELLEGILSPKGYTVDSAESGEEALEKVDMDPPDLILMDVMMPKMNGYEVCRRIRENKGLPYIPIIFITASELEQKNIVEGLGAGGDDYIRKPFDAVELHARIIACIRVKSLNDELARTKAELARYVSMSTVKLVESMASGGAPIENRNVDATVVFSDMRGFTQLSQDTAPEKVFEMLNLFLGKQIEVVEKYNGIIDKLSGDEIMAVFEGEDMAENALQCAVAIVEVLSSISLKQGEEWTSVGIGINTGPVFWGSLGTVSFKDFTVIGNTVNVAARLCGLADKYQILFTETTLKSIHDEKFHFQSIGEKMLKGLSKPTEVFQIVP